MKLAILDRDGTLNQWGEQGFIGRPEAWIAIPGLLPICLTSVIRR